MPEEEEGQPRLLPARGLRDPVQVLHHDLEAVGVGEVSLVLGTSGSAAVAPVVACVHREATVGEHSREPGVPGRVLGHAVGDLHDGPRRPIGQPSVDVETRAVRSHLGEGAGPHVSDLSAWIA